ncbi:type VI secretion system ImpA family N-terminal domain-containing protein [Tateyamaria omphalii]|uniref:type VI secretion system protein TssA n=1 Tax=Tateyamaria omphalii TaxID=299262 RepID=UPI001C98FCE9|nr:type VI secretion system ImpA family N-terminal domain-containing protein [Tateyamaria omphalii]MBY5931942.1 type VI secretion system ImpA family N-terminal domain-containing protein [Tateyamaria omphalii]
MIRHHATRLSIRNPAIARLPFYSNQRRDTSLTIVFIAYLGGQFERSTLPDDKSNAQIGITAGDNPRETEKSVADYRRLRDARSAARAEERRQEGADPVKRVLKVAREWSDVRDLATKLLRDVGRDIEVVVWLIEAETRLNGFAGLSAALGQLADMVEVHGIALHPQPEDELDRPFDIIAALNGIGREGTLIPPLRLVPLPPNGVYGEHGIWNVADGGATDLVTSALMQSGAEAVETQLEVIARARGELERCDRLLNDLLGPEAPPFSKIDETLAQAAGTIRNLVGDILSGNGAENVVDTQDTADTATTAETRADAFTTGAITSREEAFAQLLRIAIYFRRAEPHSPIADALETLVRRGRMDFTTLLAELIPDEHARSVVLTAAGINPRKDPFENED